MRSAIIKRQPFRLIFAASVLSLTSCGSVTDRALEETFEQLYTVEPTVNVTIKNTDGVVRVYGSGSNEMRVQAIKRAYTRKRLKQIAVNVLVQPGAVSIETNFPATQKWRLSDRSGTVEYTIVVPQTASISHLELNNGEVLVDGIHGQTVRARLGNGRMFDHNCFSNVDLMVARGTLTLAYEWWEQGRFLIQADMARGNAWAFLPSDAAFHLIAETVRGKIANDFGEKGTRRGEGTTKVNMPIHGGNETVIRMHVEEGNIKVVEQNP